LSYEKYNEKEESSDNKNKCKESQQSFGKDCKRLHNQVCNHTYIYTTTPSYDPGEK